MAEGEILSDVEAAKRVGAFRQAAHFVLTPPLTAEGAPMAGFGQSQFGLSELDDLVSAYREAVLAIGGKEDGVWTWRFIEHVDSVIPNVAQRRAIFDAAGDCVPDGYLRQCCVAAMEKTAIGDALLVGAATAEADELRRWEAGSKWVEVALDELRSGCAVMPLLDEAATALWVGAQKEAYVYALEMMGVTDTDGVKGNLQYRREGAAVVEAHLRNDQERPSFPGGLTQNESSLWRLAQRRALERSLEAMGPSGLKAPLEVEFKPTLFRFRQPAEGDEILHAVLAATKAGRYDFDFSPEIWGLSGDNAKMAAVSLNADLELTLQAIEHDRGVERGSSVAVFARLDSVTIGDRIKFWADGALDDGVTRRLREASGAAASAHRARGRGRAEEASRQGVASPVAEVDMTPLDGVGDTAQGFLAREAAFSQAMAASAEVREAAHRARIDAAFGRPAEDGPAMGYVTPELGLAMAAAVKPMVTSDFDGRDRLRLVLQADDVAEAMRLRAGAPANRASAEAPTPIAYLLVNNADLMTAGWHRRPATLEGLKFEGRRARSVYFDIAALGAAIDRSEAPVRALATLKAAVGLSRRRAAKMDIERDAVKSRHGGQER
jgi:hypothetical protein